METRVQSLHLRYRVAPSRATTTGVPSLARLLEAHLATALDARLSARFAFEREVVIVRDVTTRARFDAAALAQDARVLQGMVAAAERALGPLFDAGDPAKVRRFSEPAEYLAAFIVDWLDGSAEGRWYYGPLRRFEQGNARATIERVLAAHPAEVARVLCWLARRRQLRPLVHALGDDRLLAVLEDAHRERVAHALETAATLLDVASQLLVALGWRSMDARCRELAVERALAAGRPIPSFVDVRAATQWLIELVRHETTRATPATTPTSLEDVRIEQFLTAHDWLDVPWLRAELAADLPPLNRGRSITPAESNDGLPLTHATHLARLRELLAGRVFEPDAEESDEAWILQCLAALASDAEHAHLDAHSVTPALLRALPELRQAGAAARRVASVAPPASDGTPVGDRASAESAAAKGSRAALAPPAVSAEHDNAAAPEPLLAGAPTNGGGLFLLTRALLDVRLVGLARHVGVPDTQLRAAFARKLLGSSPPFDAATTLWAGTDGRQISALDACLPALETFHERLLSIVLAQRAVTPEQALANGGRFELGLPDTASGCSPRVEALLASMTALVVLAFGRWLPGLSGSSAAYLLAHALRRAASVTVADRLVTVRLEPAPLDVVLEMAGYLRPLDPVDWLGNRGVRFTIAMGASR